MNRSILLVATLSWLAAWPASAAILYESGTLGPTGVPRSDIGNETVAGTNINPFVFTGVRFFVDQPVVTTKIGGHFVRNIGATDSFFGAIVKLTDSTDFPDSANLSTPDVVGVTLLSFPEPSDEVFGDLSKALSPGWHCLVFGSGLFGAIGSGAALRNGMDINDPSYVAFQPPRWSNLTSLFSNHRFVLHGTIIPEPSAIALCSASVVIHLSRRKR